MTTGLGEPAAAPAVRLRPRMTRMTRIKGSLRLHLRCFFVDTEHTDLTDTHGLWDAIVAVIDIDAIVVAVAVAADGWHCRDVACRDVACNVSTRVHPSNPCHPCHPWPPNRTAGAVIVAVVTVVVIVSAVVVGVGWLLVVA